MVGVEETAGARRLSVSVVDEDGTAVIEVRGELDLGTVHLVKGVVEPVLAEGSTKVTFDLGALTFMDSSGIALLVSVVNRVGPLELRSATPLVRRLVEITGLSDVLRTAG